MPHRVLFHDGAFEPETVAAMTAVYDRALQELSLANKNDPLTETVARRIIALAATGVHDAERLGTLVMKEFRPQGRGT